MNRPNTIFWDWNGTLLNDAFVCMEAMNKMLLKRKKPPITLEHYQEVFDFPVEKYYQRLGFDFTEENFEDLSVEFIANYNSFVHKASLQPHALSLLQYFANKGMKQVIISAMEQKMLLKQVNDYGVTQFISKACGISDIYARSKAYLAKNYLNENNTNLDEILFIGDTLHDKEVADEIGVNAILVANGHHSRQRLSENGNKVINDLKSLLELA